MDFYRFGNTYVFVALLKNIAECISNFEVYGIKLVTDFGIIRVKTLEELEEEIKKSQLVFSIEIVFKDSNSNHLKTAISIDFQELETFKRYSSFKLYSDDRNWILETEKKIKGYLQPYKTHKKVFRSPFFTSIITTIITVLFLTSFYGGFTSLVNNRDIVAVTGFAFLALFIVYIFQIIFIPRFKLQNTNNSFIRKFKTAIGRQKESIIIAVIFFVLGLIVK